MDVGMKMLGYALSVCERVLLHLSMYRGLIIIWNKQMFSGNKTYTTEEEEDMPFLDLVFYVAGYKDDTVSVCHRLCLLFLFFLLTPPHVNPLGGSSWNTLTLHEHTFKCIYCLLSKVSG